MWAVQIGLDRFTIEREGTQYWVGRVWNRESWRRWGRWLISIQIYICKSQNTTKPYKPLTSIHFWKNVIIIRMVKYYLKIIIRIAYYIVIYYMILIRNKVLLLQIRVIIAYITFAWNMYSSLYNLCLKHVQYNHKSSI